jgi:hypothetical protein
MNSKSTFAFSLLILLSITMLGQAYAQTGLPGVKMGDEFTYSITTHWNTTNSSANIPYELAEYNKTKTYEIRVSAAMDTNVTATNIWTFENGTEINSLVIIDVVSGTMYYMNGFQGFFAANLNANDLLRAQVSDGVTINKTISRNYLGGSRETNLVEATYEVIDSTNTTTGTTTATYYIDRATGVLVERIDYTVYPDQTGSIEWKLTKTNVWDASAPLPLPAEVLVGIVVLVILAVVVVVYVLKNRKRQRKPRF